MSKDMNFVALTGHIGQDPQLKYTPAGKAVVTLSLASNSAWKDANGDKQEKTTWTRLVAWNKLAEICGEWLRKGSHIWITGELNSRSYDDKDGKKVYITEVVLREMGMLDKKGDKSEQKATAGPDDVPDASDIPF